MNHACLIFESKDFKFATDPWILGSAFANGWWLKYESPANSIEQLNSCDFIFISHSHPDHLHEETLSYIRKDMLFYTTNFETKSSEQHLRSLGFKNIEILKYDYGYIEKEKEIYFSPLKSGDFRDDSGFILKYGSFSALINVDTNFINFFKLPNKITFMASTFSSGASGFPLCFDNINLDEKHKILKLNRKSTKKINENLIKKVNPKYFMPYAGFFDEASERDKFIKENNQKNKIKDYEYLEGKFNLELLNVEKLQCYKFIGNKLTKRNGALLPENQSLNQTETIKLFKNKYDTIEDEFIVDYFVSSNFKKDFNLLIDLTNDNFKSSEQIKVTFNHNSKPKVTFVENNKISDFSNNFNTLHLKIRKDVFVYTLKNLMPWEDILIGFQARINRSPNVYNTDFWYHFSNVYTKYNASRIANECSGCDLLKFSLVK